MNLADLDRRRLMELLRSGHAIDPAALDNSEYRGTSLGLPGAVERLTWKKFKKVFYRDPATGALRGWNVRTLQNAPGEPWIARTRRGRPVTFGHFAVVAARGARVPARCDRGLLLDYGAGKNGRAHPITWLRDPLVALEAGNPNRLLGWSYLEVGSLTLPTPSFFLLERDRPLTHVAPH